MVTIVIRLVIGNSYALALSDGSHMLDIYKNFRNMW